jgi:hypothetical protein
MFAGSSLPGNEPTIPNTVSPSSRANAAMYTNALTLGRFRAALVITAPP